MTSMSCGNTSLVLVERRGDSMQCQAFNSRLLMVLNVINNGAIDPMGGGFGGPGHKKALERVARQLEETRIAIALDEERERRACEGDQE